MYTTKELEDIANRLRGNLVELHCKTKTPHLGSSLSCVEILVASYWGAMNIDPNNLSDPTRDRFILSKGHAGTTLYTALWMRGILDEKTFRDFAEPGAALPEHPVYRSAPGIDATSGSLGHGLSLGLGMCLAGRLQGNEFRTIVALSDGECNEGSVWEAAMLAPTHKLSNLIAIVDFNGWQATGRSREVTSIAPLKDKFEAFGWSTYEVDGHDVGALTEILRKTPDGSDKPVAIIANTVKGKGVSFAEDDNNWHYRILTEEEMNRSLQELGLV